MSRTLTCHRYCSGVKTTLQRDLLARFGHVLSDPTRTELLLALRSGAGYPTELAEALGATRQTVSNHLTHLRNNGLVVVIKEGRRNRYELADPRLGRLFDDVAELLVRIGPLSGGASNPGGSSGTVNRYCRRE